MSVLTDCWAFIGSLLSSRNNQNPQDCKLIGPPPCMDADAVLTEWFKMSDGKLMKTEIQKTQVGDLDIDSIKKKYPDAPMFKNSEIPFEFKLICEKLFDHASYILKIDGYHRHIIILFKGHDTLKIIQLDNNNQSDKYRTVQEVAQDVRKMGASSFIMIAEAWQAILDKGAPLIHASEIPDRTEVLMVIGANKDGEGYTISAQFKRVDDKVILSTPKITGIEGINFIKPILDLWSP